MDWKWKWTSTVWTINAAGWCFLTYYTQLASVAAIAFACVVLAMWFSLTEEITDDE